MAASDLTRVVFPLHNLDPDYKSTPWTSAWWAQNWVDGVPESGLAWMLAQGWQITGTSPDSSTSPPTIYYSMARQQMNNWVILQQLVNDFTNAYNEGRQKNALRYDDIVSAWSTLLSKTEDFFDVMTTNSNAYVGSYLSSLSGLMDVIDALIATSLGTVVTDAATVSGQLATFLAKLNDLEANYTAHLAKIETIIAAEQTDLAAYLSAYQTELATLESDYAEFLASIRAIESTSLANMTSHIAAYSTELGNLATDYATHYTAASAYLVDLGATELSRINEQFNNLLAKSRQDLVNRGFYSSALIAQTNARIERERNEAISALNDRLNREKLENEHRLYEQKVGLHDRTLAGLDRIYQIRDALQQWKDANNQKLEADLITVRLRVAEGIDRRHAMQQDVERNEAGQRHQLLGELQHAVAEVLDGQQRYVAMTLQNGEYQVDSRYKLGMQQMAADAERLKGMTQTHVSELGLMGSQLESRNKLITDLFAFMERRTDSYPSLEAISQLAVGLGDSGSTSVLGT